MNQDMQDILLFHLWLQTAHEEKYKKLHDEFEEVLRG